MGFLKDFTNKIITNLNDTRDKIFSHVETLQSNRIAGRNEKVAIRQGAKTDRTQIRQESRTDRVDTRVNGRVQSKIAAYSNGIDPNAAWAGGIASVVSSGSNAVSSMFGAAKQAEMTPEQLAAQSMGKGNNNMVMMILLAIVALFMFKRSDSRQNQKGR